MLSPALLLAPCNPLAFALLSGPLALVREIAELTTGEYVRPGARLRRLRETLAAA